MLREERKPRRRPSSWSISNTPPIHDSTEKKRRRTRDAKKKSIQRRTGNASRNDTHHHNATGGRSEKEEERLKSREETLIVRNLPGNSIFDAISITAMGLATPAPEKRKELTDEKQLHPCACFASSSLEASGEKTNRRAGSNRISGGIQ